MDRQTREAKERMKQRPFSERFKHFVYYHKIQIAFSVFILILAGVTLRDVLTSVDYDLNVVYYGDRMFTEEQIDSLKSYLAEKIEDINGDGEKNVNFVAMTKTGTTASAEYDMAIDQKFMVDIASGDSDIYIVKGNFYENIRPDSENEIAETSFPINANDKLCEILGESESGEEYWCTRMLYENQKDKEDSVKHYENAKLLESLFEE